MVLQPPSCPPFDKCPLDERDRLSGVQPLRTGTGTVHDGVATIQSEGIIQRVEPLSRRLVTTIGDPAIRLQQHHRTKIPITAPPPARTPSRAATTEDAFPISIDSFSLSH